MSSRLIKPVVLREPVIDGLLRKSELMNVTAAPKQGKSFIVTDMALAVATGTHWLGQRTTQGTVIILDNELHPETSNFRVAEVAAARGFEVDDYGERLFIENLRGKNVTVDQIEETIRRVARVNDLKYACLVILDAWYRFQSEDTDENSNSSVTAAYNLLDATAQSLGVAFALIHHTCKGNQSLKGITDVGSGAGSQSRAADCHLVIRPHEQPGCAVVDAAVRSWPPLDPFCIRWGYPVFHRVDDGSLDPRDLEPPKTSRRRERKAVAGEQPQAPHAKTWTPAEFAATFITDKPRVRAEILLEAGDAGISERMAIRLFQAVEAMSTTHAWKDGGLRKFASIPQPTLIPTEKPPKRKPGRPKKENK